MDDEECVFRRAFKDGRTSFYGYENWNEQHPLYKCAFTCDGYLNECEGYRSVNEVKNKIAKYGD